MDASSLPEIRSLVTQWLTRWHGVAHRSGSKMEFVYKNALTNLKAHDGPIRTVEDCARIKYFGPAICERVKKNMIDHWKSIGVYVEEPPQPEEDDDEGEPSSQTSTTSTKSKSGTRRKRAYVPANRSGAYAILVALYEADKKYQQSSVAKSQLLELAQPYCDESMTKPKAGSHYTAFSSMKTLIKNELVTSEQHRNAYYSLTEAGRDLGKKLYDHLNVESEATTTEDEAENVARVDRRQDQFTLVPGSFDVTLLVDTREKVTGKTNIVSELLPYGVKAELRALPAGDFVWIAKERVLQGANARNAPARELVFDFVIERKKADDLSSSIMDGRYKEQKQRLLNCGLQKPIYLVEGLNKNTNYAVPYRRLIQSITDSTVIEGFNVKCTRDFDETINYLVSVTQFIEKNLSNRTLTARPFEDAPVDEYHLISYNSFEHSAKKITNFNVQEMFVKHLIQFAQMSVPKAKAIITEYPTLRHFITAYEDCTSEKEKERLVAKLKYGYNARSIGPVLSGKLHKFYNHRPY